MGPKTAVILVTYNRPESLELVLTGVLGQTDMEFEVVVADDGSGPQTRALVERFARTSPIPIRHAWQEDRGFRAAAVRNLGVRSCDADLLVFLDQDVIPARDWMEHHRRTYAPNRFTVGGYVRLTPEESSSLDLEKVRRGVHETMMNRERRMSLWKKHIFDLFYIATLRKVFPRISGANFGVDRGLFEKVNGLDEEYEGWGKEESDLRTRMRLAGGGVRCLWHKSIVYHLWHPIHPTKADIRKNKERYLQVKRRVRPWRCERGLVQPG